ncbi:glucokinase [uncultured Rhodoblastus sp.]|uniref:glucokinase n=1 Tax=uncultured Rhodoblastus sp. TaxID=543037 RepID=UPI0025E5170E|nr:glucokinase [uncultured Rhodoblastus sp.]
MNETQAEEIVVADIGGTHARFALARIAGGRVAALGDAATLKVSDYPDLPAAWRAFAARLGREPPPRACFAVACPVRGEVLKFTNNPWVFRPGELAGELGIDELVLVNDFGAVAHAVAETDPQELIHIAGPRRPPPRPGIVSIIGPGTGLGVALLLFDRHGHRVVETEGGHAEFAPLDDFEAALALRLRQSFGRVSIERVISGSGLAQIRAAMPHAENAALFADDRDLWAAAISGDDLLARAALERFCLCLGAAAGDIALTHGAGAIVLGGGLPPRIKDFLRGPGFAQRLVAKGRYAETMADLPVWLIAHEQPGLFGAAAAFAARRP